LYQHRKSIMDGLFGNTRELLGFGETIVFYDLTNSVPRKCMEVSQ